MKSTCHSFGNCQCVSVDAEPFYPAPLVQGGMDVFFAPASRKGSSALGLRVPITISLRPRTYGALLHPLGLSRARRAKW